jgi:hypothetical protein
MGNTGIAVSRTLGQNVALELRSFSVLLLKNLFVRYQCIRINKITERGGVAVTL